MDVAWLEGRERVRMCLKGITGGGDKKVISPPIRYKIIVYTCLISSNYITGGWINRLTD